MSSPENPLQQARHRFEVTLADFAERPADLRDEDGEVEGLDRAWAIERLSALRDNVLPLIQALTSVVPGGPVDVSGVAPEDVPARLREVQAQRERGHVDSTAEEVGS